MNRRELIVGLGSAAAGDFARRRRRGDRVGISQRKKLDGRRLQWVKSTVSAVAVASPVLSASLPKRSHHGKPERPAKQTQQTEPQLL
jgi:hypothetical protein